LGLVIGLVGGEGQREEACLAVRDWLGRVEVFILVLVGG